MPTAKPFSRSDVEQRPKEDLVCELALINKLIERAGITDQTGKLKDNLDCAIREYRLKVLAYKQERPAQIVSALQPGLKPAKKLLTWLNDLPAGVLSAQQAGDIKTALDAIISTIESRLAYWQRHVKAGPPAGEGDASLALRRTLTAIITEHRPEALEWKQRNWVAFACTKIGARFPNEKKNRRRFIGEHKQKPPSDVRDTVAPEPSEAERRLKDVPI